MTFPPGTHAMWMRYWLGAGGIHPDTDVSLITIPPAQMVANMKIGKMDGFCVGEPWNARAHRRRHRLHRDHHAGALEEPSREGLRLHRGVRRQEPEDGQGGAQGAARGQRLARQAGEPARAVRHRLAADLHQLPEGADPRPPAGQVRLRRRPHAAGPGLHDLQRPQLQLPAAEVRGVVAHAVPPLGHGRRHARLRRRRQAGDAHRHLRRGDEGDRLQARRPRQQAGDAVRRRHLRSSQGRGLRQGLQGPRLKG